MSTQLQAQVKIRARGVCKVFPAVGERLEVEALRQIDLDVHDQEIVCLIGPSGCGKTTFLNLVAGFDQPTTGELLLLDQPIVRPGPDRAMVFQTPALFPWLNVMDNVSFGPHHRGEPDDTVRGRAKQLLADVGLAGWDRHFPYELSGGMRQRVQLARALINNPQVLLMDEPFGPLDWQTRSEMQALLRQVWELYRPTILLVTHDIEEAILLADRIYVLSQRPTSVVRVLEVGLEKPRTTAMLTSAEFVRMKAELLGYLSHSGGIKFDRVPSG